jgi:hypothetical protein
MNKTLLTTLRSQSNWDRIEQPFYRILIDNKQINSWVINVSLNNLDAILSRPREDVLMYLTEYHKVTDGL